MIDPEQGRRGAPTEGANGLGGGSTASEANRTVSGSRQLMLPPLWLQVGTFAVATVMIAVGLGALLMTDGTRLTTAFMPIAIGSMLILIFFQRRSSHSFDSYAAQIRDRVDKDTSAMHFNVQEGGTVHVTTREQDPATMRVSNSLEKQEAILREIYTQGLAQAKVSFRVSIIFASVGASFLLLGIGLAIVNAESNGNQYASIVAGAAGIVINLTSSVFFVQSNRARRNMGQQGVMLREESQEDRRLSASRELAGAISDEELRNRVRADLALSLVGVENLPSKSSSHDRGISDESRAEANAMPA
jgi:hypothetical protein